MLKKAAAEGQRDYLSITRTDLSIKWCQASHNADMPPAVARSALAGSGSRWMTFRQPVQSANGPVGGLKQRQGRVGRGGRPTANISPIQFGPCQAPLVHSAWRRWLASARTIIELRLSLPSGNCDHLWHADWLFIQAQLGSRKPASGGLEEGRESRVAAGTKLAGTLAATTS